MAGRPTKYDPVYNEMVYKLCLLGATDEEIADFLNIAESTVNEWKNVYPEFSESIKKGKIQADAEIAESLYNRAKGFTRMVQVVKNNDEGEPEQLTNETYYPPDPTSMIYWLKNRRGRVNELKGAQKWADKHEHVHDGSVPVTLVFKDDPRNQPLKDGEAGTGNK